MLFKEALKKSRLREDITMALINVMEEIVDEKISAMIASEKCCKCKRCLEDMKAYALNKLPAKYVSSYNGELFTKLASVARQNSVDINVAVANAIDCVSSHPSHEGIIEDEEETAVNS